jgi:hypothetical protein
MISLTLLRVRADQPIQIGSEPGGIGQGEIKAHAPITTARSEHQVEWTDKSRTDHVRGRSRFQNGAISFIDAGYNRVRKLGFLLHFWSSRLFTRMRDFKRKNTKNDCAVCVIKNNR